MPTKALLEDYPLYKAIELVLPYQRHRWPQPSINVACPICGSSQTFNVVGTYDQRDEAEPKPGPGGYYPPFSPCIRVVYRCAGCGRSHRYFLLLVAHEKQQRGSGGMFPPPTEGKAVVQKVGQYPPWDIAPDSQLARKLGDSVGVFKKGLICESQSFGLGAFAYF